jgi:hypothetical protein
VGALLLGSEDRVARTFIGWAAVIGR